MIEDFLTHLAERTLGVAPVVQPMIASTFAPEPTYHLSGLEWDGEAPTLSGDLVQPRASWPQEEEEPVWNAAMAQQEDQSDVAPTMPKRPQKTSDTAKPDFVTQAQGGTGPASHPSSGFQEGTVESEARPRASWPQEEEEPVWNAAMAQQEDQSDVAPTMPKRPQKTSDTAKPDFVKPRVPFRQGDQQNLSSAAPGSPQRTPESRARWSPLSESGSSERRVVPEKKDQQDSSQAMSRHPRTPSESRPGTLHHAGPGPTRRAPLYTSQRVVPENLPVGRSSTENELDQTVFGPIGSRVEGGQGAIVPPRPSPGVRASLDASEDTLKSKATLNRSAPRDIPSPVMSEIVRHQPNRYLEQGSREPRVAAPEPPVPTIRVDIGRIEVRAITPPPVPPAQRTAPARPKPTLSLDDYLKQRNGG